jgi:hypothetical protein
VLIKFTAPHDKSIAARWRDLRLATQQALKSLAAGGASVAEAARSRLVDMGAPRLLT